MIVFAGTLVAFTGIATCSRTCLNLSLVLFLTSVGYELTGIGNLDSIGAVLIAWLSWKEGREAFQKADGVSCGYCCHQSQNI